MFSFSTMAPTKKAKVPKRSAAKEAKVTLGDTAGMKHALDTAVVEVGSPWLTSLLTELFFSVWSNQATKKITLTQTFDSRLAS